MQKKYRDQNNDSNQKNQGEVGETVIAKKPLNQKESNKNVGDYVDYEDVKE